MNNQNQKNLDYLKKCFENNTIAHAYSFVGHNRSGRMDLLRKFLGEFIPAQNTANHPDIKIIEPENSIIAIREIREARSWLSLTPISSDKKVLIIKSAGAMRVEAQNAFLKMLEEPSQQSYIFLLINHKSQVLQTIYSRIVPLYFAPAPDKHLSTYDYSLIQKIMETEDKSRRMRIWLEESMKKEDIKLWLWGAVPFLRQQMSRTKSASIARAIRNILAAFQNPSGQNWKLVAEHVIISV